MSLVNCLWREALQVLDSQISLSLSLSFRSFSGAPIYASLSPFDSQSAISDVDPNINCFDNSEICHPTTLVEHYINYQIAGLQNNTNELAGLELVLQNVTTTALSNAAAFIRNVKYGTQPLNPDYEDDYPEYDRANEANFQNFNMTAEKLVQRTKVRFRESDIQGESDRADLIHFSLFSAHSEQVAAHHRNLWRCNYSYHCFHTTSSSSRRNAFGQRNRLDPHH